VPTQWNTEQLAEAVEIRRKVAARLAAMIGLPQPEAELFAATVEWLQALLGLLAAMARLVRWEVERFALVIGALVASGRLEAERTKPAAL
jgi:hypothetical protein